MMNIFGIEPPHRHNGTWSNVEDFLSSGWEARSVPENTRGFAVTNRQMPLMYFTILISSFIVYSQLLYCDR